MTDNEPQSPKLRFPEFRSAPEWESAPIGDKVDLLSGYPFDGPDITQDEKGVKLLRGINVTEGRIRHSADIDRYYLGNLQGLEKYRLQLNDLVIGMDGSKVGKNSALVSVVDVDALLIQRVARLRAQSPEIIHFIYHHINSTAFHEYVDRINTSSGIPHISAGQIREFEIYFPGTAEQQKIADCLSSLDDLIAAEAQKLDALNTYRKGLLQQLFPREGETTPRLRFPEFRDAGEWEEKQLDQLADIYSGGTPSKSNVKFWNGEVPWISAKDMKQLFLTDSEDHISPAAVKSGAKLFPSGTLLMLTRGMTLLKDVPICILQREMSFNQDVKALQSKSGVSSLFLAWMLIANKQRLLSMVDKAGHGTGKLNSDELKALMLTLPHPDEQECIAIHLTTLEDWTHSETQKLGALLIHKKGLMQQLFPSPEAVDA